MDKIKIFSILTLVVALGLGYYLYASIKKPIEEKNRIEKIEKQVINQLKLIREAQKGYVSTNGNYAKKWDELISFLDTGKIFNIQKKEIIIPRPNKPWLGDSVAFEYDTLGSETALQKIFPKDKYSNFDYKKIHIIPGSNKEFSLFADEIDMSGVNVDVIEVVDIDPADKTRTEDNKRRNRKPLRFGSRTEVTTAGNWE